MGNFCSRKSTPGRQGPYVVNGSPGTSASASAEADFPSLRPPSKSKERLIPKTSLYQELKNKGQYTYARNVESLSATLTRECPDDLHKVRAFFCWIAANITYDVAAMNGNDVKAQEPEMVLRTKRAVCQGFSQLFRALCRQAGIPCLMVSGLDKGLDYDPQAVFTAHTPTNHAWNLVHVLGEWRPLDVTWGAGHIDQNRRFQREFTEHWFLTDPAEFITDHFPLLDGNVKESEKYQLLKRPYTVDQFSAALRLKSVAYDLGVRPLSHPRAIIRVRRDVTITLRASRQPLENVRVTLAPRGRGGVAGCSNILTWLDIDGTCQIYVRPPREGTYELDVKGNGRGQDRGTVYQLLSYIIECTEAHPEQDPFPDKPEPWGLKRPEATGCGLKAVRKAPYSFKADRRGEATVTVALAPPTDKAAAPRGSNSTILRADLMPAKKMDQKLEGYTQVNYTSSTAATVTARLPSPGYYLLRLYAGLARRDPQAPNSFSLTHCADYLLHADATPGDRTCASPFPQALGSAHTHGVTLLSPLTAKVPAGQKSLYRIRAPDLALVKIGDMQMVRKGGKGGVWEAETSPPRGAKKLMMYGATGADAARMGVLFEFTVV